MELLIEFVMWLPVALFMAVVIVGVGVWIHHTSSGCTPRDWWRQ